VSGFTTRVAIVVAGLAVMGTVAQGQRRIRGGRAVMVDRPAVGPRVGYDFDLKHVFIGGQLNLPVGRRWGLVPSAEFYLSQPGSPFRLNADVKYHPPTVYGLFYFGAGFAYLHASGASDAGANLFAGWEGRRARPFKPFLEAKLVIANNTSFNVLAGLNFPL
jgi:hypothetical protein